MKYDKDSWKENVKCSFEYGMLIQKVQAFEEIDTNQSGMGALDQRVSKF